MAVRSETEFLDRAAEVMKVDRATISLDGTTVPQEHLDRIIDILAFPGCSVWRDELPKDRVPTLREVGGIIHHFSGD